MKYAALEVIGRNQQMLATRSQIRGEYSEREMRTMTGKGLIMPMAPEVYRIIGAEPTFRQRIYAALLDAGCGVPSYFSAGNLWGLLATPDLEITVPHGANSKNTLAKLHRSRYRTRRAHVSLRSPSRRGVL